MARITSVKINGTSYDLGLAAYELSNATVAKLGGVVVSGIKTGDKYTADGNTESAAITGINGGQLVLNGVNNAALIQIAPFIPSDAEKDTYDTTGAATSYDIHTLMNMIVAADRAVAAVKADENSDGATTLQSAIANQIKAESAALYAKIMTGGDEQNEFDTHFDTLKEIAAWITTGNTALIKNPEYNADTNPTVPEYIPDPNADNHAHLTAGDLLAKIATLENVVGNAESGLVKKVADIETALTETGATGSRIAALEGRANGIDEALGEKSTNKLGTIYSRIEDIEESLGDGEGGIGDRVETLETTVGDTSSGLVQNVNTLNTKTAVLTSENVDKYVKIDNSGNLVTKTIQDIGDELFALTESSSGSGVFELEIKTTAPEVTA